MMTETLQHQTPLVIDSPEAMLQQSMYMILAQVAAWEAIERAMAKAEDEEIKTKPNITT